MLLKDVLLLNLWRILRDFQNKILGVKKLRTHEHALADACSDEIWHSP
jgi:hypothetical protein